MPSKLAIENQLIEGEWPLNHDMNKSAVLVQSAEISLGNTPRQDGYTGKVLIDNREGYRRTKFLDKHMLNGIL